MCSNHVSRSSTSDWPSRKWSKRGSHCVSVTKLSSRSCGHDAHRHIFAAEIQRDVGRGVLLLVPVLLEILQQEVAIADLAHLGREGKALAQVLAMLLDELIAIIDIGLGQDAGSTLAQIVGAAVEDAPEVDFSRSLPANAEEIAAVVHELRAFRGAAQAKVVEAHGPVGSLRAVLDAQQLVGGEIAEELVSENAVFIESQAAEEERRIVQVRGERRPIEDRHLLEIQDVVLRRDQLLVLAPACSSAGRSAAAR